jgi:hypothetical protein
MVPHAHKSLSSRLIIGICIFQILLQNIIDICMRYATCLHICFLIITNNRKRRCSFTTVNFFSNTKPLSLPHETTIFHRKMRWSFTTVISETARRRPYKVSVISVYTWAWDPPFQSVCFGNYTRRSSTSRRPELVSLYFAVSLSRLPSTGNRGSNIEYITVRRPSAGQPATAAAGGALANTDGPDHLTIQLAGLAYTRH